MKRLVLPIIIFITSINVMAQDNKFPSILIKENESYTFDRDTLLLDTLVMEDNTEIYFTKDVFVVIKHGFFGDNTTFNLSGVDGMNGAHGTKYADDGDNGTNGADARNIEMLVQFEYVGSFNINAKGGNGGSGGSGYNPRQNEVVGAQGFDGGDAGKGGDGGNGGNIKLSYLSPNFVPLFNSEGKNTINLIVNKGLGGNPGRYGRGGAGGQGEYIVQKQNNEVIVISDIKEGLRGHDGISADASLDGSEGTIKLNKISGLESM